MNREVHVRFWESAGLRCPAPLTYLHAYVSVAEARAGIGAWLHFYNEERLWCIKCDGDRPRPLCRFSGDFLGDWHAEAGHAVDHRAGDASLDLLCGQSPSPEARAD
jgi:hypothetical protein